MTLLDILTESCQKFTNHPALIMRMGYRTVVLTYAQVYALAQQTAAFLQANGVGKGDCVVVCAPNSPYWGCLFWGCLLRGAVIVPLNTQSTDDLVDKVVKQTEAKLFFTSRVLRHSMTGVSTFTLELLDDLVAPYRGHTPIVHKAQPGDLIEILYTSGTTGDPKGVMLTHANLMTNVQAMSHIMALRPMHERLLSVLPLSHILEQTVGFLLPCTCGATIVYAHSHGAIAQLLAEFRVTKMVVVPEFLKVLMARVMAKVHDAGWLGFVKRLMIMSGRLPWWMRRLLFYPILKPLGGCLNMVASGGASLDPDLEAQWNAFGVQVIQGYGLTETSPVITMNSFTDHRPGSVGKVVPGVALRLSSDGEIQVKGTSVFGGYFKNDHKTSQVFTADGWFMTGDMGALDTDGFLFIKGRRKYMIKGAGAQNVYPEDIEEHLNRVSAIKDSCVVGLEQPGGAVQVHAVLLLRQPLEEKQIDTLVAGVNGNLATYQRIGGWSVWSEDDFPRSATRKIKKEVILEFLKGGVAHAPVQGEHRSSSKLMVLLASMTGVPVDTITPTTVLVRQLHLDSLMTVELLARIEEAFFISTEGWIIGPTTTVADVQGWIERGAPAQKPVRLKAWPRSWWARLLRFIGQPLVVLFVRMLVRVTVEGKEHVPGQNAPVIFMPNHVSMIDPFFIMAALPAKVRRRISFAAAYDVLYKDFWFVVPMTELLAYTFPFPRKETENVAQGLTLMGQVLDRGYSAVVFPEGQVSESGQLLPLKAGAGLIATQMQVPVVPVALFGVRGAVGPAGLWPKFRAHIVVRFGQPFMVNRTLSIAYATAEVEKAIVTVMKKR